MNYASDLMQNRFTLFLGSLLAVGIVVIVWLSTDEKGSVSHGAVNEVAGQAALRKLKTSDGMLANPGLVTQATISPGSLFGLGASPFGRLDCSPNRPTSACSPDENNGGDQVNAPLMTQIRDLSEELLRGKFDSAKELTLNLRECRARLAVSHLRLTSGTQPDEQKFWQEWECNSDDLVRLGALVQSYLERGARDGSEAAKVAYAEFLRSELIDAVAANYRDRNAGVDLSSSRAKFLESRSKAIAYANSGALNSRDAAALIRDAEQFEIEAS